MVSYMINSSSFGGDSTVGLWGLGVRVFAWCGVCLQGKLRLGNRGPFGWIMPWGPQKNALRSVLSLLSCDWAHP
ncbi:hypothetical protein VYU27_002796 [Nannochloropsis oceanica]